jgi:rod shape determining protein RodA
LKWHGYLDQTDYVVVICVILISIFGLVMVHSATLQDSHFSYLALKQFLWVLMGLGWLVFVTGFDYHKLLQYSWWLYGLNLAMLIGVMLIGKSGGGAVRWLSIAGFQFQPSELSKIILILSLTRYLTDYYDHFNEMKYVLGAFILIGIPMVLIMKQPDLGTSLILVPILFGMLYVAGARPKYLLYPVLAGAILSPIAFMFLKQYQKNRLLIFIDSVTRSVPGIMSFNRKSPLVPGNCSVAAG